MTATSPWTPGTRGGWWPADSATPASTSTRPWGPEPTPARKPDDTLTDELEVVRADAPSPAASAPPPAAPARPTSVRPAAPPARPDPPTVEPALATVESKPPAPSSTPTPAADDDTTAFWLPREETPTESGGWPMRRLRGGRPTTGGMSSGPGTRSRKPWKRPRSAAAGLASLVLLSLLATFFAWVSAEPLWLALGHGESGTATVTRCTGSGVQQRCVGTFTGGGFTREQVRLLGVESRQRAEGTQIEARMIDRGADSAYVGAATGPLHLRWGLGLGLVLLCGVGIAWGTGALRMDDRKSRLRATLTALGAPVLMVIGFLAAAF